MDHKTIGAEIDLEIDRLEIIMMEAGEKIEMDIQTRIINDEQTIILAIITIDIINNNLKFQ